MVLMHFMRDDDRNIPVSQLVNKYPYPRPEENVREQWDVARATRIPRPDRPCPWKWNLRGFKHERWLLAGGPCPGQLLFGPLEDLGLCDQVDGGHGHGLGPIHRGLHPALRPRRAAEFLRVQGQVSL